MKLLKLTPIILLLLIISGCSSKEKKLIEIIESSSELVIPKKYEVLENSIIKEDDKTVEILKLLFDDKTFDEIVTQVHSLQTKNPSSWHLSNDIYSYHGGKIDENYVIYLFINNQTLVLDYSKETSE